MPKPVPGLNARHLPLDRFEAEMKLLARHFQVVSLRQLATGDYDKSRLAVALTFDDGYANNLHHAIPVLRRLGIPATFLVTAIRGLGTDIHWPDQLNLAARAGTPSVSLRGITYRSNGRNDFLHPTSGASLVQTALFHPDPAFIPDLQAALEQDARFRKRPEWEDHWQLLSQSEIAQIQGEHSFDIGSHSARHYNLAVIPREQAVADMAFSKQCLEAITGSPLEFFAYPSEKFTPELHQAAFGLGFQWLLLGGVSSPAEKQDSRLLTRFGPHPAVSPRVQMHFLERGYY